VRRPSKAGISDHRTLLVSFDNIRTSLTLFSAWRRLAKILLSSQHHFSQRNHEEDKETDRKRGERNGSRRKKIKIHLILGEKTAAGYSGRRNPQSRSTPVANQEKGGTRREVLFGHKCVDLCAIENNAL